MALSIRPIYRAPNAAGNMDFPGVDRLECNAHPYMVGRRRSERNKEALQYDTSPETSEARDIEWSRHCTDVGRSILTP